MRLIFPLIFGLIGYYFGLWWVLGVALAFIGLVVYLSDLESGHLRDQMLRKIAEQDAREIEWERKL